MQNCSLYKIILPSKFKTIESLKNALILIFKWKFTMYFNDLNR